MPTDSEIVTVINRSSKNLEGVWDGKRHPIPAGGKVQVPHVMAMKFKLQHPVMGTENKYTGEMKYLLGIEEDGDELTPIEQSNAISFEDLSARILSGELRVVQGNGLYRPAIDSSRPFVAPPNSAVDATTFSKDTGFDKP